MIKNFFRVFFVVVLTLALSAISSSAAPFNVIAKSPVLAAPDPTAPVITELPLGQAVEVTHQAGNYWRVSLEGGKSGYIRASALSQVKTKGGGFAVPIAVNLAAPSAKVVISKAIGFFKALVDPDGKLAKAADEILSIGKELIVQAKEPNGWLKVQTPDGKSGFIKEAPGVVYLHSVDFVGGEVANVWQNSKPIPMGTGGLTLQVEVRRPDGTPVPAGSPLKLGDEYRIFVTPSADAYVRITCETPEANHVCQYYPNQFPGTQQSALFHAGKTHSSELLPKGFNFKVDKPLGSKDVLRIEATTVAPFIYVPDQDGCVSLMKYKGGGFSLSGKIPNPTPQIVVEYPIVTHP